MQQEVLTDLLNKSLKDETFDKKTLTDLAEVNALRVKDKPGVTGVNIPTAEGLEAIGIWIRDYKRNNPSFSKRKVRRDVQAHFNIKIFRTPYKTEKA